MLDRDEVMTKNSEETKKGSNGKNGAGLSPALPLRFAAAGAAGAGIGGAASLLMLELQRNGGVVSGMGTHGCMAGGGSGAGAGGVLFGGGDFFDEDARVSAADEGAIYIGVVVSQPRRWGRTLSAVSREVARAAAGVHGVQTRDGVSGAAAELPVEGATVDVCLVFPDEAHCPTVPRSDSQPRLTFHTMISLLRESGLETCAPRLRVLA